MKRNGEEYFFEIKTVKPNIDVFEKSKIKLLEWVARSRKSVHVFLAFPYNPYHPEPYNLWTMRGMLDLKNELKVAEEFWNFLRGEGTYQQLLDSFERVGIELRSEIDEYFAKYNLQ